MYNSKLMQMLHSLKNSKREIASFERFVNSPFYNTNERVINLFYYIKKHWRASETMQRKMLAKKVVFKNIFPVASDSQYQKINQCISDLSKLLEQFFTITALENEHDTSRLIFIKALKKRGINKYFFSDTLRLLNKSLYTKEKMKNGRGNFVLDAKKYLELSTIFKLLYLHPSSDNIFTVSEKKELLKKQQKSLQQFGCLQNLQLSCELFVRNKKYGESFDEIEVNNTIANAEHLFANDSLVSIYCTLLRLFQSKDSNLVVPLKIAIFEYIKRHRAVGSKAKNKNKPFKQGLDLVIFLINAIPANMPNKLQQYEELYRFALREQLLIEDGLMELSHFMNIIEICCQMNRFVLAEKFVDFHKHYLNNSEDKLENIQCLLDAHISFHKKEYMETWIKLYNLKLENVEYGLRYHLLLLMNIIEAKNINLRINFQAKCQAFKTYINRKCKAGIISKEVKQSIYNFINLVKKIQGYNNGKRKYTADKLLGELESFAHVVRRRWLRKILEDLK